MTPRHHPPRFLTSRTFWSAVKWVLIVTLLFATINVYRVRSSDETRAARAEAIAIAEQKARRVEKLSTISSDWRACKRNVPALARVNDFVSGVNEFAVTSIENAERTHAVTPRSDPVWAKQVANIAASREALAKMSRVRFPNLTLLDCWNKRNTDRKAQGLRPFPVPPTLVDVKP